MRLGIPQAWPARTEGTRGVGLKDLDSDLQGGVAGCCCLSTLGLKERLGTPLWGKFKVLSVCYHLIDPAYSLPLAGWPVTLPLMVHHLKSRNYPLFLVLVAGAVGLAQIGGSGGI